MQTINKETKEFNGSTLFVEAIVQLEPADLATIVNRSSVGDFDTRIQRALAEFIAEDLRIGNTHKTVVCCCWHEPQTELLTWNVEAVYVRNFAEAAFV